MFDGSIRSESGSLPPLGKGWIVQSESGVVVICAQAEADISELESKEEREEFLWFVASFMVAMILMVVGSYLENAS